MNQLFLVAVSPDIWNQFVGFYVERQENHRPEFTPHGAWVVDSEFVDVADGGKIVKSPRLVAGCCFYPTKTGPFMMCEYVSTRPGISKRLAHAACERVAWAIRMYGAMCGLRPVTFPKHKGVRRMLAKAGFNPVKQEVSVMWAPAVCPVGQISISSPEVKLAAE